MNEFIESDNIILVNCVYMEAYIHESIFDSGEKKNSSIAYAYGDGFRLIGEFNVRIFDTETPENVYSYPLRTFNYPNIIETYPTDVIKANISIDGSSDPTKVRIFKYFKGDTMMTLESKQDTKNCEAFIALMNKGKIPNTIPYDDLINIWDKNFEINGISAGVPSVIREAMIATTYRDAKDPTIPFRFTAGKNSNYNKTGYYAANMRETTKFTNVASALTFEDIGSMLTTSLNISRENKKQIKSPFEILLNM